MKEQCWPETYKAKYYWRERRLARVGDILTPFLSGLDSENASKLVPLWKNWEQTVGGEIAKMAKPLGHKGKTLLLAAEDPMVSQHLSFYIPDILGAVNAFLGWTAFEGIRFELANGRPLLDKE